MSIDVDSLAVPYQQQLHQKLVAKGVLDNEHINNAFLAVPRHPFVQKYYLPDQRGWYITVKERPGVDASEDAWKEWFQSIYQDVPLVTQVDRHAMPTSSSSMPSLMAKMLNALDARPGHHVLEIGMATGYNAALLCHIVQSPDRVTTIELDPELARLAQQRLDPLVARGIKRPIVITGNALEWIGEGSCYYDRIIATASWPSIPSLWVHHLALDGILVMEVHGPFISVLVRLHKQPDGQITASLIHGWNGAFMALRQKPDDDAMNPKKIMKDLPLLATYEIPAHEFAYEHLKRPGLALLLQYLFPTVQIRRQYAADGKTTIYLVDHVHSAQSKIEHAQDNPWTVTSSGMQDLWRKYQEAIELWESWGKPDVSAYTIECRLPEGVLMPTIHPKK